MADDVTLRVFARAPFNQYVTTHTRFWKASGLNVSFGAGGLQVKVASLRDCRWAASPSIRRRRRT